MIKPSRSLDQIAAASIVVVQHWGEELKARVPVP